MRRHRLTGLPVLLVLSAALVVPRGPVASAAPPLLVVEGSRSAVTAVTLREPTTLRLRDVVLRGGRSHVGWWLVPVGTRPRVDFSQRVGAGGVVPTALSFGPDFGWFDQVGLGETDAEEITLPAGRYLLALYADGPARITVPLTRGSGLVVRPSARLRSGAGAEELEVTDAGVLSAAAANATQSYGRALAEITVSSLLIESREGFGAISFSAEADEGSGECLRAGGWTGQYLNPLTPFALRLSTIYDAGTGPAGDVRACQNLHGAGTIDRAVGGFLVLQPPG